MIYALVYDQVLWKILIEDADLLAHLRIIKDFYLLGRGELYLAFIDQAQHLLRVQVSATTEHGILNKIQEKLFL